MMVPHVVRRMCPGATAQECPGVAIGLPDFSFNLAGHSIQSPRATVSRPLQLLVVTHASLTTGKLKNNWASGAMPASANMQAASRAGNSAR
jgi:hypothetical protein